MLVDSGKQKVVAQLAGVNPLEQLDFCLYTNNPTWSRSTNLAALTEAGWAGYARAGVPSTDWSAFSFDAAGDGTLTATVLSSFTNSSGVVVTANGFFVVGHTSGILYGGAPFNTPLNISPGHTVSSYSQLLVNTL